MNGIETSEQMWKVVDDRRVEVNRLTNQVLSKYINRCTFNLSVEPVVVKLNIYLPGVNSHSSLKLIDAEEYLEDHSMQDDEFDSIWSGACDEKQLSPPASPSCFDKIT